MTSTVQNGSTGATRKGKGRAWQKLGSASLLLACLVGFAACAAWVMPIQTNGPSAAEPNSSYSVPQTGTTGAYLNFQIFDDNTGMIAYNNDNFQPPGELWTRERYNFTWTQTGPSEITVSFEGQEAILRNIRDVISGTSFVTDFDDGRNQVEAMKFLYFGFGN